MKLRLLQSVILLVLAACGSSARTNARDSVESGAANLPASDPPFTTAAVAAFDNPWAMAFLPGTNIAIVTEKSGAIWLVDAARGQKQQVSGAPQVVYSGQGGFTRHCRRARVRKQSIGLPDLFRAVEKRRQRPRARPGEAGPRCERSAPRWPGGALARSSRRRGRPVRRDRRFCAGRPIAFPDIGRAAALHAGAGPEPADWQDPASDARRETGAGQSASWEDGCGDGDNYGSAEGHRNGQGRGGPHGQMAWPESHARRDMDARSPQSVRARVRSRRPAVGDGNGTARRRRAQPDPGGEELRVAAGFRRQELRRRRDPQTFHSS